MTHRFWPRISETNPEPKLAFLSGYYTYDNNNDIWVDFANHKLGGGVCGNGMVQEEMMALSMPELAECGRHRTNMTSALTGTKMGAYASNPLPLLFENIQRTIDVRDEFLQGRVAKN